MLGLSDTRGVIEELADTESNDALTNGLFETLPLPVSLHENVVSVETDEL
jgi:hypothetical protein